MPGVQQAEFALEAADLAHAMRRDDGENARLKAHDEGVDMPGLVTSDQSERSIGQRVAQSREAGARS